MVTLCTCVLIHDRGTGRHLEYVSKLMACCLSATMSGHTTPRTAHDDLPFAALQVGIPILGVVENMSGLRQQLHEFKFFSTDSAGSQQDVTQQVLRHLPAELQVIMMSVMTSIIVCMHAGFQDVQH